MAHILLMEDDLDQAFLFAEYLRRAGHEVAHAESANAALELLDGRSFDMIVTDIFVRSGAASLPDGGLTLIGRVRNREMMAFGAHPPMPIIAISGGYATAQPDVLTLAKSVGADMCFSKPVELDLLVEEVERLLTERQG